MRQIALRMNDVEMIYDTAVSGGYSYQNYRDVVRRRSWDVKELHSNTAGFLIRCKARMSRRGHILSISCRT